MSNVKHNEGHLEEQEQKKRKDIQNSRTADTREQ